MDGVTGFLIKLGARLAVFGFVFYAAARRNPKVELPHKWATPLIALVFAAMNTGLYWALTPLLNLATLGAIGFLMPFVVNLILLYATVRIFASKKWIVLETAMTYVWLAAWLTAAHGLLWFALDYVPGRA
ncbi:MAG TPA: hypothetical protein VN253_24550 [Kofleriaceae bacterium]|nr:hypothetical protein [Kofleriaceae bacterium]